MYTLRFYQDEFLPLASARPMEAQHSIVYIYSGSAIINDTELWKDNALYSADVMNAQAGEDGAVIWRWELVRTEEPNNYAVGAGVKSRLRMSRKIRMFELSPRTKWLFKLDGIYGNTGCTGLHSHPGSGIRCLLKGELNVQGTVAEWSRNNKMGDCWYEEGSYPIVSTTPEGAEPADFLRGMILPVEYSKHGDTARWIEGAKDRSDRPQDLVPYRIFVREIISLR